MLTIPKSKSEFLYGAAGAALLLSLAFGASAWFELKEFQMALADQEVPSLVSGRLQVKPKRIFLVANGVVALDCASAFCSYPGALNDEGRFVTVGVTGGRIVEVIADGQRRDFREHIISSKRSSMSRAAMGLVLAILLGIFGFQTRLKNDRKRVFDHGET